MTESEHLIDPADNRRYIRLKSIFPVKFSIVRLQGDLPGINWQQGYTCNVSDGGLCLETVHLDESTIKFLSDESIYLDLRIQIPIAGPGIKAVAEVAWFKKEQDEDSDKYYVGLKFRSITREDLNRIQKHAQWFRFSAKTAVIASMVLFIALLASGLYNFKLRSTNEKLVAGLVQAQHEETGTVKELEDLQKKKDNLSDQLKEASSDVSERKNLENQLNVLVRHEERITDKLVVLERKKSGMQKKIIDKMHLWLSNHQSPTTGLVLSFQGHMNIIKNWAFTYDQSLAANAFLLFNDTHSTRKILNFYKRNITEDFKGFYNAYYYDSGDASEYIVHCGPNIWIGIAMLQYAYKTGDQTYVPVAKKIADWLITIQNKDPAGGLKGGERLPWFSTEHNLDAYAFFDMLYELTKDEKYALAQKKIFSWLKTYAMVPHGKDYKSPPMNRGRGDSTIATDTYAWALAAIGPDKLQAIGMDPEKILNFAEEHCSVEVDYRRPSGAVVRTKGFDFSKHTHMPRGGLISPEWTSQMIVSYQMLRDYFDRNNNLVKSSYYGEKANMYLNEMNKLIISSPSPKGQGEGCLPYATLENADTGHGWNTPQGSSTCSIAGTAYMIMAMREFNPLMFERE